MKKCRFVLVDDDNDEMDFLKDALEETGRITVQSVCCNYDDLIAVLTTSPPDLIICDIHMPGKTGIDICRDLQAVQHYQHIPLVLLTGTAPTQAIVDAAKQYNALAILLKPCGLDEYRNLAEELFTFYEKISGFKVGEIG